MQNSIQYLLFVILIYYFILSIWYLVSILYSFPKIIRTFNNITFGNIPRIISDNLLPMSIIIPSYNGGRSLLNAIYSILKSHYKNIQIVVVDDGSTNNTLTILKDEFELREIPPVFKKTIPTCRIHHVYQSKKYRNLFVLEKEHCPANNGADSNNAGLNFATSPLFMTIDDDTILEPSALTLMIFSFLSQPNTLSVGGALRVLGSNKVEQGVIITKNISDQALTALQSVEYLRSFTYGRASLDISLGGGAMCFPGAFSLYETKIIKDAGGYDTLNPSYDAEIVMKVQHIMRNRQYPTNLHFMSGSFAWTKVPSTLKTYFNQRARWHYGMAKSVLRHIGMFMNPRYGFVGMVSFPGYIAFELFGSIVEFISYVILLFAIIFGSITCKVFLLFFLLAWGYFILVSILSYFLDFLTFDSYKEINIFRIIYFVTIEMFGVRQLRAVACTYGVLKFFIERLIRLFH